MKPKHQNAMNVNTIKQLLICFILWTNITTAFSQYTGRIIYITEFHKEGGRRTWWGGTRYNEVNKIVNISDTPTTGYTIHRTTITCLHEGNEKCTKKLESPLSLSQDATIAKEIIDNITEAELDSIDIEIIENAIYSGNKSRTIILPTIEGNNAYVRLQSVWNNGTTDGDADIRITLMDISNNI